MVKGVVPELAVGALYVYSPTGAGAEGTILVEVDAVELVDDRLLE